MAVTTTSILSGPYAGNDITTEFSYTFRVTDKSELSVYEIDSSNVISLLTVDVDYTVADVGVDGGGTVTRTAGALPSGYTWLIRSNYDYTQGTAFTSQGTFHPAVHEEAIDKLTFLVQQHDDRLNRTLSVGLTDNLGNDIAVPSAVDRANAFLGFDENGDIDFSIGQGYIDTTISTEADARAAADTTLQNNIDAEAATRADADTTLQANIDANTSAINAVEVSGVARVTSEDFTATAGQTTFTLTTTAFAGADTLAVFVNGVRQQQAAYTTPNSTSVTLTEALNEGDAVTLVVNEAPSSTFSSTQLTDFYVPYGSTVDRPIPGRIGYHYFDTTIGKPIWWNGSVWKDATGATV